MCIALFEATQVVASVADIVLDILVCIEFYSKQRWEAFYLSLVIFFIAQNAYALLFVASFGQNISTSRGCIKVYLTALPFSQFVPLFQWIESFHFQAVDSMLHALKLSPSLRENAPSPSLADDYALWSYANSKFKSNIGFLLESVVEAIPQAAVQTWVVVTYGEADLLVVISILMSVFVVASKGYMLSYSVHAATFIFNAVCIVADVTGLFAALVWMFSSCTANSLASPDPFRLYTLWINLAEIAVVLISTSGLALAIFANMDDHLKLSLSSSDRIQDVTIKLRTDNVYFDIWLVRTVTWAIAILPVSVIAISLKTSALPLFYFKSVEPAHFAFPEVYHELFTYVNKAGPSKSAARLYELNNLLGLALLQASRVRYSVLVAAANPSELNLMGVRNFVRKLGVSSSNAPVRQHVRTTEAEVNHVPENETPQEHRARTRKENRRTHIEQNLSEFERRSVIWSFVTGVDFGVDADTEESEEMDESEWNGYHRLQNVWNDNLEQKILRFGGLLSLVTTFVLCIILCPILLLMSLAGMVIPYAGLFFWVTSEASWTFESLLGVILSVTSMLCQCTLLFLAHSVGEFQSAAKDLIRLSDYEDNLGGNAFYKVMLGEIVKEAYIRHRQAIGTQALQDFLAEQTNQDCSRIILSYLGPQHKEGF